MKYSTLLYAVYSTFFLFSTGSYAHYLEVEPALNRVDYSNTNNWLCLPDKEGICSRDIKIIDSKTGSSYIQKKEDVDTGVDCFYIYPTASMDKTLMSDLLPGEFEEKMWALEKINYLKNTCRIYTPMYRQITVPSLVQSMKDSNDMSPPVWNDKTQVNDVQDAFDYYLKHFNKGRKIVIISHSQGSTIAKKLISLSIEGKPVQKNILYIFLAGNTQLGNYKSTPYGDFKSIKTCKSVKDTGCVIAWSSYIKDSSDAKEDKKVMGGADEGMIPLCVSPSQIDGSHYLNSLFIDKGTIADNKEATFYHYTSAIKAKCVHKDRFNYLELDIVDQKRAQLLEDYLSRDKLAAGWGAHNHDIGLVLGNIDKIIKDKVAEMKAIN
ncbi:TPA: DUF3089 domain-containing protein [Pluralibacter gergoviae]|uniref:DUF3089 domain-containing protein n=1 Tax=Pluralibacter gergoviae TaxID=61647 RepID=UPI0006514612|nr:DUF3089 domain-containing protein [Pluralibacter gergoviae]KMK26428.1 hypothetical protein ABW10_02910 [Pluralibacter gergoviae]MBL3691843.1 DUF3089 domain-containing protein [Pluralibacter gergoviae]HDS1150414.1 DUF3089 domain-containing protein [Pluralibacter gergoviae]